MAASYSTPLATHHIAAGALHQLSVTEYGNPSGIAVLVVHGGPGGRCHPAMTRFFDPHRCRIIMLDQRGTGMSTPHGECEANTTADLVADMERVRHHLRLDSWVLFGGSWGVTLSLAYAKAHPQRVQGMVLRGVFLCRPKDLAWLYQADGAARLYPDAWQALQAPLPATSTDLLSAYYHGLRGPDASRLARAWCNWEACLAHQPTLPDGDANDDELAMALLETHYFVHHGFLQAPILDGLHGLAQPVEIVHGTQDHVCPPEQAWQLAQHVPLATLNWVVGGSHASSDPLIEAALIAAVDRLLMRIQEPA